MNSSNNRQRVVVFDVNETLLDIETLNPFFAHSFGDARVMRQWFAELIIYSQAISLSGAGYMPFGELAVAVLKMVGQIREVDVTPAHVGAFKELMANLPAHADAAPALDLLKQAGLRMVTLTNSASDAGGSVLQRAGLAPYFERQFSVQAVHRFKPAPETYRSVASALGVDAGALRLVAAHTWDTLGARAAGWHAALVARPGNAALAVGEQPDIVEKDLVAVARRIIELDT